MSFLLLGWNTLTQSNLGGKSFVWLTLLGHNPSLRESGQEPETEHHEGTMLAGWNPGLSLTLLYSLTPPA